MSDKLVPIGEAKARLSELVRDSATDDVVLIRHSRPAAVIVEYDRYQGLLERLEDAEDRLAVLDAPGDTISLGELKAGLGVGDRSTVKAS